MTTYARPITITNNSLTITGADTPLLRQPDPAMCATDELYTSPNGEFLLWQVNCEADLFVRLLHRGQMASTATAIPRSYFLDWSPDGNWFLLRQIDEDMVYLAAADGSQRAADGSQQIPLDLPFGTYGGTFSRDGQTVLYVASQGLNFGSELGALNLVTGTRTTWQQFPDQIVAYPQWSPDGSRLAYILLPDSNLPYTSGELWLADPTNGLPLTLLDTVDAGHGYPPAWSPDGSSIAYVRRENPDSVRANHLPGALRSNLYQVDVTDQTITQLTHFPNSLVYDIAWSPDGSQLAFTADDAIWLLTPGQTPTQFTNTTTTARHPAWLVESN